MEGETKKVNGKVKGASDFKVSAVSAVVPDNKNQSCSLKLGRLKDSGVLEDNPLVKEYNLLMSAMHVSVSKHLMRADFHVIWANDYYYEMTGYTKEEYELLFNNSCQKYYRDYPEEYDRITAIVKQAVKEGGKSFSATVALPQKDGSHIYIKLSGTVTDEVIDGFPVIYTTFTDVSESVRMEKERTVTYDKLPGFIAKIQVSGDGMKLLYGNSKFEDFFGSVDSEEGKRILAENMNLCMPILNDSRDKLLKGLPITFDYRARGIGGRQAQFRISADCIDFRANNPVYLVIYIDITELAEQREKYRALAYEDAVTGGPNRTDFDNRAMKLIRSSPPDSYALLSLDIQKFKVINDLFGIESGDRALKFVYDKLAASLRAGELAARISADTFAVLLEADSESVIVKRLEKLAAAVNSFNTSLMHKYLLTLRAGIFYVNKTELPMTQLHDRAILARKRGSAALGNHLCHCHFYKRGEREKLSKEKDIENRMEDALENGEFKVYLQPKMDLRTGRAAGAEALVRWDMPGRGIVAPDEFIPLFEANGFIVRLDLYVFEQVCALLKKWIDEGRPPLPVSVNMSRMHLGDENFLSRYERVRSRYNVPQRLLEIEITETLMYENPKLLLKTVNDIRGLGYSCSMDDFGSGYSSLSMLKDVRVDVLKLDRAFFTSEQMQDERERKVVRSIIGMAKELGMITVAEGVESVGQAEFLTAAGCDLLQGYYFSRPVDCERFEREILSFA